MYQLVLLLFLVVFTSLNALNCVFHTDPIHPVNPRFEEIQTTNLKQYTCNEADRYCVYFEGTLETTGRMQRFSVRSCESDLMYYAGPIGETIGHRIEVDCKDEGVVEKRVGALSYYINCCKEPNCDNKQARLRNGDSSVFALSTLIMSALPLLIVYLFE